MKHIDVHYHWIHWVIEQGALHLVYCPTDNMVVLRMDDTFSRFEITQKED